MLMMGFTKDGQLDQQLLADRDKNFNISTDEIRSKRKDIPMPHVDSTANAWEKGIIKQFIIANSADSAKNKHSSH